MSKNQIIGIAGLDIDHLSVVSKDIVRGAPVAFKDSGASAATRSNPTDTFRVQNIVDRGPLFWSWGDHPFDESIEGAAVILIFHKCRGIVQFAAPKGSEKIRGIMRSR